MGYDVSDYRAIYPPFGTLADAQDLIDGLHARGMRLLMDLVVNHTSDEHPWFVESKNGGKDEEKGDWYFWRDGKVADDGKTRVEPNNWKSFFEGSAWHWVESRKQYCKHFGLF